MNDTSSCVSNPLFPVAPEVYQHMEYTENVDVYSYAMILFYLLDGRPPWPSDNGLVAVKKAAYEGDRPPVPRHWDERLQNLLQQAWHETPSLRPPFNSILKSLNEYARKSIIRRIPFVDYSAAGDCDTLISSYLFFYLVPRRRVPRRVRSFDCFRRKSQQSM